ncbi:NACHT domain-containing NTPase [Dysgonomonas sp. 521]|uniref:NACHT domain-containing protein n=1 Tax=Dysgonomonas sp. 521 TaxID=2302932 RepID=UPI0013D307C2|nr:hypothetical protein [Dysgonomonas sp. 521]
MRNSDIEEVYKRYGYITKNIDGILVCEYKQGRYFGVDIIKNGYPERIDKIQNDYRKSNFATYIKEYASIEEIEEELFKSFFQLSAFRTNLNRKYDVFVEKQTIGLPSTAKYLYINSDYTYSNYNSEGIMTSNTEVENQSVVKQVVDLLNTTDIPVFVIIEAAAGYGKTCTAYEIIKQMEENNTEILPFYIELSKNREARIFKHILQNEIDEQFQNVVKSDVVLHQIKQGKIPVIIDGFDELLSKDLSANTSQLRDIESMLSTIVNLLDGKAKIVITSRKTAIFSGEEFYEWIKNTNKKYDVARFSISEPKIENWLESDRLEVLNNCSFPISNVANPVLLSYIRNIEIDELHNLVQNSKNIVDKYFEFLLNREQIRQELFLDENMQLRIFKKLVRIMSEFDIKADSKSFIKDIIKDYNRKIFDDYIKNYPKIPKPTHDELAETLSNHALLDRKQHDNVGFINEFILGILIGRNLIEKKYQEHYPTDFTKIITQEFAFLAISAFKVQPQERKDALWQILHDNQFPYDSKFRFYRDFYLMNNFIDIYEGILIEDLSFENMYFRIDGQFKNSIISNCKFDQCKFDICAFDNSGFINCKFFNCEWINDPLYKDSNMYITGCDSNNFFENKLYEYEEQTESQVNVEELILRKFIKSQTKVNNMKRLSSIRESLKEQNINMREFENTISLLKRNSYIVINGDNCFIQREGITYFNHTYSYEQ